MLPMYKDLQTMVDGGPPFLSKHTKLPSHLQSNNMLENIGLKYFLDWKNRIHRYIDIDRYVSFEKCTPIYKKTEDD